MVINIKAGQEGENHSRNADENGDLPEITAAPVNRVGEIAKKAGGKEGEEIFRRERKLTYKTVIELALADAFADGGKTWEQLRRRQRGTTEVNWNKIRQCTASD